MTYLLAPGRCVLQRCAWSQVLGAARRVRLSSCWWICRERGISFFHWASLCITSEVPSARDAPTVCGGGKARLLLLGRWRGMPAWSQVGGDVGLLLSPGGSGGSRLALAHYLQLLCELGRGGTPVVRSPSGSVAESASRWGRWNHRDFIWLSRG